MYDEITCPKCGFNPKEQNGGYDENNFKSYHWQVSYEMEYFPSIDRIKSWEEMNCPICGEVVHNTL